MFGRKKEVKHQPTVWANLQSGGQPTEPTYRVTEGAGESESESEGRNYAETNNDGHSNNCYDCCVSVVPVVCS